MLNLQLLNVQCSITEEGRCQTFNYLSYTQVVTVDSGTRWLTAEEQHTWRSFLSGVQTLMSAVEGQLARDSAIPHGYYEILVRLSEADLGTIRTWIESGAGSASSPKAEALAQVTQDDVIPIMLRHCTACHGRYRKEANLDLRTPAGMLRGGKSGPGFVPGKPASSRIIQRIAAGEMPPPKRLVEACVKPVEKSELDTLTKWIAAGAPVAAVAPDAFARALNRLGRVLKDWPASVAATRTA